MAILGPLLTAGVLYANDPALGVSPSLYDFGSTSIGETTASVSFVLTNTSSETLECDLPELVGAGANDFSIQSSSGFCDVGLWPAETSCVVELSFAPEAGGARHSELIRSCSDGQELSAQITGYAHTPKLHVGPALYDYGQVFVSTSSHPQTFTLTNSGSGNASGCGVPSLISGNPQVFSVINSTCSTTLAASQSCEFQVVAHPMSSGHHTARISQNCSVGGDVEVQLSAQTPTPVTMLDVMPEAVNFGSTVLGDLGSAEHFIFQNTGTGPTTLCSAPVLTGRDRFDFLITQDNCGTQDLGPGGASCSVEVRPFPLSLGNKRATLTRTCLVGGTARTETNGLEVNASEAIVELAWSPEQVNFSEVMLGELSSIEFITLENVGNVSVQCAAPALAGDHPLDFLLAGETTCQEGVLVPEESCVVAVMTQPGALGERQALLEVDCGGAGLQQSSLTSFGVAPVLAIDLEEYDFGSILLGAYSQSIEFTMSNSGNIPTGLCDAPEVVGADAESFVINFDGCGQDELPPEGSCFVSIQASPQTLGANEATLVRTCELGGELSAQLSVLGIAPTLALTPANHHFGEVFVNADSSEQVFTLSNSGTGPATGCSNPVLLGEGSEHFSLLPATSCTGQDLVAGDSCSIVVQANPLSADELSASLSISCGDGGTHESLLSVTGVADLSPGPTLALNPESHNFGFAVVGGDSKDETFFLSNLSETEVADCSLAEISGPNASDFSILWGQTTCGTSIAADSVCQIEVSFGPQSIGQEKSAALEIACDGHDPLSAQLMGTAVEGGALTANDFRYDSTLPETPMAVFFSSESEVHPQGHDIVSVVWSFGDGSDDLVVNFDAEEDEQEVFHYYLFDTPTASYTVTKMVVDEFGSSEIYEETILLTKGRAPVPYVTADNYVITAGSTVNFDGSLASDPDNGGIAIYAMEFGDLEWIIDLSPFFSNQYPNAGVFPFSFAVMDVDNHIAFAEGVFRIFVDEPNEGQIPYASYHAGPRLGGPGLEIELDASEHSFDVDGTIERTVFFAPNGHLGQRYLEGPLATQTYFIPGNYMLEARVVDNSGHVSVNENREFSFIWGEEELSPQPQFFATKLNLTNIGLEANTTRGAVDYDSYYWDFGDGNHGTGIAVSHFYETSGVYTVTLTVRGVNGEIASISKDIYVDAAVNNPSTFESDGPLPPVELEESFSVKLTHILDGHSQVDPKVYWDFGDGTPLLESSIVDSVPAEGKISEGAHSYTGSPKYVDVRAYIESAPPPIGSGLSHIVRKTINAYEGVLPVGSIVYEADNQNDFLFTFDASGSTGDGVELGFIWEIIEEGQAPLFAFQEATDVRFGEQIEHEFSSTGIHHVRLWVRDEGGNTALTSTSVNIEENAHRGQLSRSRPRPVTWEEHVRSYVVRKRAAIARTLQTFLDNHLGE